MNNYKLVYSIDESGTKGELSNLLNETKKINNLKIGLQVKDRLDEIIPFINTAYNDDCVIGMVPYHKSSIDLRNFNFNKSKYLNYNCNFCYFSNRHYLVLRSDNSRRPMDSESSLSNYSKYEWFSKDENWELVFKSPDDQNDQNKINLIIKLLKQGYDLKIKIFFNNYHYILKPNIIYFATNQEVSIKTYPIILFEKKAEEAKNFKEVEILANLSGKVSLLNTITYSSFLNKEKSFLKKIINKINKKLSLISFSKPKCINTDLNIEWYIKND